MIELETREWIAYGLIAAALLGIGAYYAWHQHKSYWRRRRMAGDTVAKQREKRRR